MLFHDFSGGHSPREVFAYLGIEGASEYRPSRQEWADAKRRREAEARALEAAKLAACADIWEGSDGLPDTPGALYLWNRGLVLNGCPDIRFHRAAPRKAAYNMVLGEQPPPPPHPALICLARNGAGDPRGVHATYVTEQGRKAFGDNSRLMFGPMRGAAVRTAPITRDGVLAVAEGLETAGAFSLLRSVPCWATFSTSGLKAFEVPPQVRRLIIAADNDENGAGMAAAIVLAERARTRCDVEIEVPEHEGDWNAVLMAGAE